MVKKEAITYYTHLLVKPIAINGRIIKQIDISSHCDKHLKHGVTHELIMKFVKMLDKGEFEIDGQDGNKLYFKAYFYDKDENYKLVWW
jgi:hypothetical protein